MRPRPVARYTSPRWRTWWKATPLIDIALLHSDPHLVRRTVAQRAADVDVDRLVEIDEQLREANARFTRLRGQRRPAMNRTPADPGGAPESARDALRAAGDEVRALQQLRDELWAGVPNLLAADTPAGPDAGSNVQLRRAGDPGPAGEACRYDAVGTTLGLLTADSAAPDDAAPDDASPDDPAPDDAAGPGARWRGDGARLAQAVFTHAQHVLQARGFTPVPNPPPRAADLLARYGDQILDDAGLPLRVCAFCSDQGAVEQLVLCRPADSAARLDECQRNAEEILRDLELPYRVLRVCAGALEAPEHKSYHTEVWFPGAGGYRRTHSAADHTDYQARRLRIRVLDRGRVAQPHTVRATAATDRTVLAILENHVQPDGSVHVPSALRRYLDGRTRIEPATG